MRPYRAPMGDGWVLVWIVVAFVVFVVAFVGVWRQVGHHYDALNCRRFGEESSREVRFVDYTFWSWDCLTPSGEGTWIPTDRLWESDR